MRIDVLTVFPEMVEHAASQSIVGRARRSGALDVRAWDLRDFTADRHRTTDDSPYGGGVGMVMKVEPIDAALRAIGATDDGGTRDAHVVLMSPQGQKLDQELVRVLASYGRIVLICGRYEGVDERVREHLVDREVSIGDYVLSGGELPALVIIEAISRMVPGVVGDWESVTTDSFYESLLGPPQYTRPPVFRGIEAPMVLREGNHAAIQRWRRKEALRVTRARRPDLLKLCNEEDRLLLEEIDREEAERKRGEQP